MTSFVPNTANAGIVIPAGVTLASGRGTGTSLGALIYSNARYTEGLGVAMFKTGGPNVRITGLRLRGPFGEVGNESYNAIGVSNAIRSYSSNLEVDNCELYNWDKWAIWFYFYNGANIHHNHFHDNLRNGYGYSIWFGGSGSETNAYGLAEANFFERCRHCIASSGHPNSWEARYNIISDQNLFTNIDRHDSSTTGWGGKNTDLHHNLFMDTDNSSYGIAVSDPTINGLAHIFTNWFFKSQHSNDDFPKASHMSIYPGRVNVEDLRFGFDSSYLPNASFTASTTDGVVPLTVSFDASASSDKDNYTIRNYFWQMGDGTDTRGVTKTIKKPSYKFTKAGLYIVKLMVQNSKGIPGFATKDILVRPATTGKFLSLWLLDSYWKFNKFL